MATPGLADQPSPATVSWWRRAQAGFLAAFTNWFTTAACFWQTTVALIGLAVIEFLDPRLDPHGFWLLWALTLFSAWTQPALAHAGAVSAAQMEVVLARMEAIERQSLDLQQQLLAMEERILKRIEAAP